MYVLVRISVAPLRRRFVLGLLVVRGEPQVNSNVAGDRHMVLHEGNILDQAHYVPKLVAAATDDDGLVRSAKESKKTSASAN